MFLLHHLLMIQMVLASIFPSSSAMAMHARRDLVECFGYVTPGTLPCWRRTQNMRWCTGDVAPLMATLTVNRVCWEEGGTLGA